MGSSSKKTTTNQTQVQTPNAPAWASSALQDFTSKAGAWGNTNAQDLVAPESALQQQAATGAAGLGSWKPTLDNAVTGATNAAYTGGAQIGSTAQAGSQGYTPTNTTSASLLSGLGDYMNPYTDNVVNTTLAGYDRNAGQQQAAMAAKAAGNGAFAGSRYGIAEGDLGAQLAQGRAQTEAQLRDSAFNTAAGLSNSDAARRQDTSDFNAGAANTASQFGAGAANAVSLANASADNATARANQDSTNTGLARQLQAVGLLGSLGASQDTLANNDITQQAAQGATAQAVDAAHRTAGLSQLQALGSLLGQGQFGLLTGQTSNLTGTSTTTSSPSLLSQLGQGLSTAGSLGDLFNPVTKSLSSLFSAGRGMSTVTG